MYRGEINTEIIIPRDSGAVFQNIVLAKSWPSYSGYTWNYYLRIASLFFMIWNFIDKDGNGSRSFFLFYSPYWDRIHIWDFNEGKSYYKNYNDFIHQTMNDLYTSLLHNFFFKSIHWPKNYTSYQLETELKIYLTVMCINIHSMIANQCCYRWN